MEQTITLNMPYDLSESECKAVMTVYESMDGWINADNGIYWYGNSPGAPFINASSEASGLVVTGSIDEIIWLGWITKLSAKLSIALNREIYDAEM
jgi:hypothetical protein